MNQTCRLLVNLNTHNYHCSTSCQCLHHSLPYCHTLANRQIRKSIADIRIFAIFKYNHPPDWLSLIFEQTHSGYFLAYVTFWKLVQFLTLSCLYPILLLALVAHYHSYQIDPHDESWFEYEWFTKDNRFICKYKCILILNYVPMWGVNNFERW